MHRFDGDKQGSERLTWTRTSDEKGGSRAAAQHAKVFVVILINMEIKTGAECRASESRGEQELELDLDGVPSRGREVRGVAGASVRGKGPALPASMTSSSAPASPGGGRPRRHRIGRRGGAEEGPARLPAMLANGRGGAEQGAARPPALLTKGGGGLPPDSSGHGWRSHCG